MNNLLKILPKPHSKGQAEFLTHKGSMAVFAGRRWGKTLICGVRLLKFGFTDPGLYWWVGLSWKAASMKRAWRTMKQWHKKIWEAKGENPDKYINKTDREMYFPDGFTLWFRTAENPESLQGEGVKGIVIDEVAFMNREIWEQYVEPCTIDFAAWVVMISSANGCNWYDEFWETIKRGDRTNWIAREYTTFDNPIIANNSVRRAHLDEILKNTPPEIVAQQYFAKRISTVNKAFDPKAVKDCRKSGVSERPYEYGVFYVAWVDGSGGGQNRYALSIMHKEIRDGQEILVQDFKAAKGFAHTKATTKEYAKVLKRYKIFKVVGDKYSGSWIVNEFLSNGISYEQSNKTKSQLFQDASVVVNQRRVEYLDDADTEMQLIAIECKFLGDHFKYEKPRNMNDDLANVLCGNIFQLDKIQVSLKDVTIKVNKESQKLHGEHEHASSIVDVIM